MYRTLKQMRFPVFLLSLLLSLSLAARKAPKWKEGNFETTASGLQYKMVKQGKGESIHGTDFVRVEMTHYKTSDKSIELNKNKKKYVTTLFSMNENGVLPGIREATALLKKGGEAYFKIPPSAGKGKDTIFCFIRVKDVFPQASIIQPTQTDSIPADTVQVDSVKFAVNDPNKKYFGDTLIALMKLTEQPQLVNCGASKVLIAFKFEMTYFENGMQRKSVLIFVECPELYGKDYFVAGKDYMVTCIPLMDDLKTGKRTMNNYSLQKLESYYGLRVSRMGN